MNAVEIEEASGAPLQDIARTSPLSLRSYRVC
jgi:hypothetical protein